MKKQSIRTRLLLAALATGVVYLPVTAEGAVTSPVTVTDPNAIITDDISVTGGTNPRAITIPKSVSGGTIQIDSKNITVNQTGDKNGDKGLIQIDEGYEGTVQLADGLNVTGTFSSTAVRMAGMESSWRIGIQGNRPPAPYPWATIPPSVSSIKTRTTMPPTR